MEKNDITNTREIYDTSYNTGSEKFQSVFITSLRPFSKWDELAQCDVLIHYLHKIMDTDFLDDEIVRNKIFNSLYSYSTHIIKDVEEFFGIMYLQALDIFLDKVVKVHLKYCKK